MKKHVFLILFITISYFVLKSPPQCLAVDKGGCLTCHRYPGLVKFEKPDKFKVLHIDEEKHISSKHGKTDCKQCHPQIVQFPHTNVTDVDCTTECHLEDKEKIDTIDPAYFVNFHKDERFAITLLNDKSSCRVCHPLYPHSENNKVRALVNMHTGFMLCEVCHLKKDKLKYLAYDWKEPEEFEFTGEPYGTHQKRENEENGETESLITRMLKIFSSQKDDSDETQKTEYVISRIAVFKTGKKGGILLINTKDNEKAREYLDKEKNISPEERKEQLSYFHRDIARKEISFACNECHSPDGILDFQALGFDDKKTKDLQYLNIKSLVTKYKTFIIPNLFGH